MEYRISYAILLTLLLSSYAFSYLDITELSSFQYTIDISNQPVLLDEATEKEGVLLSSKYGQKYQCQYESFSQFSQKVREEEENASKQSVVGLLEPMETSPCLILTTGWWTYEFCYKKYIKQFHVAEQKISGDILYLGFYAEEFDWGAKSEKEVSEVRHRYHSHQYVNGSLCDLTGSTRSAEVRFKCKEEGHDALVSVEEPSTCKYLIHVTTPHLCKHPSLRQVPEKTSLPIVCNPVLADSDYKDYVEYQKRLAEEKDKDENTQHENKNELLLTGDGSSELYGSSEDGDIDGDGFGFIEIGNTRVKFYVLNYDALAADNKEIKTESNNIEGKKDLVPSSDSSSSSPPLESTSEPLESSSSSSHEMTSEVKSSESNALQLDSDKENKLEEMFGKDSKEFLEIYKRLISNKKLQSFVEQSRSPKRETPDVRAQAEVSEAASEDPAKVDEDFSIEDEGVVEEYVPSKEGPSTEAKKEVVADEDYDKDMLKAYLEGLFASAGGKELVNSLEETEVVVEHEIAEKETATSTDVVEKVSQKETIDEVTSGKDEKDAQPTNEGVTKTEADRVVSEEHKNIHNMIMAIIKQSDRGAKEVNRHASMKKNYEFNWEKQKKLLKIQKKSKKNDDEL